MRHRKSGRKLGRNSSHRKAMYRNMAASLVHHEIIRNSFAFGNVVLIVSCCSSDAAMLRYIALRCDEFLPSFRPDLR